MTRASIGVGLDGVGEAVSGVDRLRKSMRDLDSTAKSSGLSRDFGQVKGALDGLGISFASLVANADRAGKSMLGITDLDITGAKRRYVELDEMISRLAITGGRSVAQLKQQFRDLATSKHVTEKELVTSAAGINTEIQDPDLAVSVQPVLVEEQKRTGRPREQLDRFAVKAINEMGVRSPQELQRLFATTRRLAQETTFPGGEQGLQNVMGMVDMRQVAVRGEKGRSELAALIARLGEGQAFPRAAEKAQGFISAIAGLDPNMLVRTLGREGSAGIFDQDMRRDVLKIAEQLKKKYGRRFPKEYQRLGAMLNELGGAAMGAGATLNQLDAEEVRGLGDAGQTRVQIFRDQEQAQRAAAARLRALREGPRYEETQAGRRENRRADSENFETRIGAEAQKAEDAYKQLPPDMRRLSEAVGGYVPGMNAAMGAAAYAVGDAQEQARTKPVDNAAEAEREKVLRALREGARQGVREGMKDAAKGPDQGPSNYVRGAKATKKN